VFFKHYHLIGRLSGAQFNILIQKLSDLAEEGKISLEVVPVVHEAAKEAATDAKQKADFIKAYNNDICFYRSVLFILGTIIAISTLSLCAVSHES
jgi:hypothetical protein